ncbi:hypothetical protein AJ80_08244 [Polytolypa hystricis UAMH7299]|uniref:Acyltransferase 3 domain-containing protein n=1 Tax=Polytolypa hystricis (strain UAMH7299) TaxID=1447883 RepID=A0A2B7XAE7_POLH7|nr:hypothetical protein AJ80_08244 [Polytolypa hystricis UAMH7299]
MKYAQTKNSVRVHAVDSTWADGLRGIASIFIVSSHITLCFCRSIVPPSQGYDGPVALFQRPILRLIGQGNAFVAVFFVLLGYVNSLKAISLSRTGSIPDALSNLASSSFRRSGRLIFPAAACTLISWFLCQIGFFDFARRSDAYWLQVTTPVPSASWGQAVYDLAHELVYTWIYKENRYDQPQWALAHLFKGSMYIFMVLLATINATPAFRLSAEVILYIWSWLSNDSIVLINVFAGMVLAELSFYLKPTSPSRLTSPIPYLSALLGLYLCSYPDSFAEQTPWSRQLLELGQRIFPQGAMMGRYWPGLGAQILCFSVLNSPSMRKALSSPVLKWLGGLSYPIYLLHGMVMRSLMAWLTFGPVAISASLHQQTHQQQELADHQQPASFTNTTDLIPQPSPFVILIALPLFFAALLALASSWAKHVEPIFAQTTVRFERFARTLGGGGGVGARKGLDDDEPRKEKRLLLPL